MSLNLPYLAQCNMRHVYYIVLHIISVFISDVSSKSVYLFNEIRLLLLSEKQLLKSEYLTCFVHWDMYIFNFSLKHVTQHARHYQIVYAALEINNILDNNDH